MKATQERTSAEMKFVQAKLRPPISKWKPGQRPVMRDSWHVWTD
jgi:hypothetical protein